METQARGPEFGTDRTAAQRPPNAESSFFRYHGIWAPGVRMFRRLGFAGKAAVMAGAFVLVVGQLMGLFVHRAVTEIRHASQERIGVTALNDLQAALTQALNLRASLADGQSAARAASAEKLRLIEAQVASAQSRLAGGASADEATAILQFVRQAMEPLAKPAEDPDEAFTQADGLVQQLVRASSALSDLTGIAADPQVIAQSLARGAVLDGPTLAAAIGRVADLGAAATRTGQVSSSARRIVVGETYQLYKQVEQLFARYEGLVKLDPALQEQLAYVETFDKINLVLRLSRRALPAEGAAPGDGTPLATAGAEATAALMALNGRSLTALDQRLEQHAEAEMQLLMLQMGFVAMCLAMTIYMFRCFSLVTSGGMAEIRRHIDAMANGNLNTAPRAHGRDEAGKVLNALGTTQASLRELLGEVRGCAEQILASSTDVSSGADDLSRQVERSAAHMQKATASMEEIADRCRQTAGQVGSCATSGNHAAEMATTGRQRIEALVTQIEELRASSQKVGDIVGVIDSIAFQTNILALNAAVEAARAGEQGRGFAVVASEVRSLAQRSAAAAREIKTLVGTSCEQSQKGAVAVQQAGQSIKALADEVLSIGQMLGSVSGANEEQAGQVSKVATSIAELDRQLQSNTALVAQAASAASSMHAKADQLSLAASRFSI
jgi:methyl-accepting chemotaxis protein